MRNTAWIKLRLPPNASQAGPWVLNVPLPFIDSLSLFQRDATGHWTEQKSGDQIAHGDWTHPSLTPAFHLVLNAQEPQDVYLRIRNYSPAYIPLRLFTQADFDALQSTEFLVFGGVLGLLLTLCVISALRFMEHRYPADLGAFAYGLLVTLTIAQINGVLSMTVWHDFPLLANLGSKLIATVAVGGSLLYMRQLYALSVHYHRFDRLLGVTGAATIALGVAMGLLEPASAGLVESTVCVFATFVAMAAALLSWRQQSPIWPWLMVATVPQSLCVLWLAAETFGLVLPRWEIRYVTSLCMGVSVPALAYALRVVTRDRKERIGRTLHLDRQDALTGLLNRDVFDSHLSDALMRVRQNQEPVALAVIDLINHGNIVATYGHAVSEQCELRAVVKLHRVLRDVDPASRIGTGKFALLLEGVQSRDVLNERMVKLIASGLTPLPGLQPEVPLQFHAACVLLHEQPLNAASAIEDLLAILATIGPGTRRPIRYIEATETVPYLAPTSS